MSADLSSELLDQALARFTAGEEWDAIGPTFGKTGNAIRKQVRRAQMAGRIDAQMGGAQATKSGEPSVGVAWTETADGATLESGTSATIRTLDDLLAVCEVDLSRWTVERFVVNKWDNVMRGAEPGAATTTELFQVKAWLAPIKGAAAAAELVASLIADMREHSPQYPAVTYPGILDSSDRHMVVISMADQHIGLLSWAPESGESYDADIAERLAAEAMENVLSKAAAYSPELVTVVFAGDFLHTDEQSLFMLGDVVSAWYRNDPGVAVDNPPAPRCYQRYGATLLGFCHGHNEKPDRLPMLMASEARDDWAATTFQDWFTGHLHRAGVVLKEDSGVQIHTAPSLCAADAWHSAKGLMHRRTCVAHVYEYDSGPVAQLTFNAPRRLAV